MTLAEGILALITAALDAYNQHKSGAITQQQALDNINMLHAQLQAQFGAEDAALAAKFGTGGGGSGPPK